MILVESIKSPQSTAVRVQEKYGEKATQQLQHKNKKGNKRDTDRDSGTQLPLVERGNDGRHEQTRNKASSMYVSTAVQQSFSCGVSALRTETEELAYKRSPFNAPKKKTLTYLRA